MKMLGNERFEILYHVDVTRKDLPSLAKSAKELIKRAIDERLTVDPVGFGKPLRYSLAGHRRLRVSVYRVVYYIDIPKNLVVVVAIKHRKDIYSDLN